MTERGATVLYDVPGPRTRLRNNALTLAFGVVLLLVAYFVWTKFDEKGQWDGKLWQPFLRADTWTELILPGLLNTLVAAALAAVLALLFGAVFGIARLSDHRWVRIAAAVVVEAFRAVPVLMLIFFAQYGGSLAGLVVTEFTAVVFGLTVYNGSVLAEIVRAGILAVPRGQAEAGYAIGLRKNQVMRMILLPQAVTAMMPAIVSQLVVLLKDTALGFVVAYADLLNAGARVVPANYANLIPSVIVIAVVYIAINLALGYLAAWLERRSRRSRKITADPAAAERAGGEVAFVR
ncbi:amino acid ABC transporter permease [Microbispora cellulosiformans]|uniref:Amino acid ABC transporter permease n=1 Tax=Microbispora cellulosiformans TaxID=2614688 RepID=A0A5J5JWP0_9ACTN|nr:amino acid ABC transporter permease [Microbispora cellulosiformans]KAA9375738.1 amino acid ABC transporter permease [Microbispora cellulosiformans]